MDGPVIALILALVAAGSAAFWYLRRIGRSVDRRREPDGGVETAAVVGLVGGSVLAGGDQDYAPGRGWDPSGVADAGGGWGGLGGGDGGGDGGDGGGGGGD